MREPIFLRPTGKDYLWGGSRLNDEFVKDIPMEPLAETWECSTHPDGPSFAVGGDFDGQSLAQILKDHPEFLGTHPDSGDELPILIKFIDAKKDLSVQVHPTDDFAAVHENGQRGKTEIHDYYAADVKTDYGVTPTEFIEVKALMGDAYVIYSCAFIIVQLVLLWTLARKQAPGRRNLPAGRSAGKRSK